VNFYTPEKIGTSKPGTTLCPYFEVIHVNIWAVTPFMTAD